MLQRLILKKVVQCTVEYGISEIKQRKVHEKLEFRRS